MANANTPGTSIANPDSADANADLDSYFTNYGKDDGEGNGTDENDGAGDDKSDEDKSTTEVEKSTDGEGENEVDKSGDGEGDEDAKKEAEGKENTKIAESLKRLDEREKTVRELENNFNKKLEEGIKARLPDFTGKDATDVLKHFGHDVEIVFKEMLHDRLPDTLDGKPNPTKQKLADELKDYKRNKERDKEVKQLKDDLAKRDAEAATQKFVTEFTDKTRENVKKIDQKVFPTMKEVADKDLEFVHREVIKEVFDDATAAQSRGEQRDLLSFEEAAKRVEARYAKLAKLLRTTDKKPKGSLNSPSVKSPISKSAPEKSIQQLTEEAVLEGVAEFNKVNKKK